MKTNDKDYLLWEARRAGNCTGQSRPVADADGAGCHWAALVMVLCAVVMWWLR